MKKYFTFIEWLVIFTLMSFFIIYSVDAKPKTKKIYALQTYGNISVMVTNVTENKIVRSQNIDQIRGLASMTKLMTAMTALDYDMNMNRKLQMSRLAGSRAPKREYTRGELFHMLLIKSDNAAAETLAADYPGGREMFIRDMNIRAEILGMFNTKFEDPSGLSPGNVSTASDVTEMVIMASNYPEIREISIKKTAMIIAPSKNKNRSFVIHNTNRALLSQIDGVQISKTGFTNPAGFCVAMLVAKHVNDTIQYEVVVVMGARNPAQRVDAVKKVLYNITIIDDNVTNGGNNV